DLTGDIHLVATWDPLIKDNLPAGDITLPVTLDFQAHDRLSCSENQLTITNADVEVPRDTAVKGTAGCVLEPPWEGSITIVASWIPPPDVPGPIDWQFDENLSKEVTLEAGDQRVELDFVTTDELDNKRWDLTGEIHLVLGSNNGEELPLEEHVLTVPLNLKGRSNSALAFWLAILIAIASVLITYGGLYWLLVSTNRLPSPEKFWVLEKDLIVGRGPTGRLHAPDLDRFRPSGDDLNPVTGDRQKRKWLKAGQLRINAAHASFWNLPGLLAGGWGQAEETGRLFNATPPGRYPGTTRVLFDRLTVVAVDVEPQSASPAATIYFLVPRSGPLSGTEAVEAQIPEAKTLIDDLTERYEQDTTARDLDHHDDDDSLSPSPPPGPSGPPPPPPPG
ncbi:MAG: hypothetical protein QGI09_06610, partial [Dehalococcoidia bacterium]|nr:hypothetical protein [Dehalococcoidia bacterium]